MNYDVVLTENIENALNSLVVVLKEPKEKIIKNGMLTNIALLSMPNYKNYEKIISGITQARMMKGVNGKNKIESQVKKIFSTYDLNQINEDIIEKSIELMIATFDSIFSKSGQKLKKNYTQAIEDIEFLYINLRLAVKIIAESLKNEGISLSNKTLNYITDGIKKEKKDIASKYIEAYVSGNQVALENARQNYREKMELMLNNYIKNLDIPYDDAVDVGKEQLIVSTLGANNLDYITSFLLLQVKDKIYLDNRIQRMLEF